MSWTRSSIIHPWLALCLSFEILWWHSSLSALQLEGWRQLKIAELFSLRSSNILTERSPFYTTPGHNCQPSSRVLPLMGIHSLPWVVISVHKYLHLLILYFIKCYFHLTTGVHVWIGRLIHTPELIYILNSITIKNLARLPFSQKLHADSKLNVEMQRTQ